MRNQQLSELSHKIKTWGLSLGFQQVGITDVALETHEQHLANWLKKGYEGEMSYMSRHGTKRSRPAELIPGTQRIISVRMDYLPKTEAQPLTLLDHPRDAYVSRYALGRDYHKVLRGRLRTLLQQIEAYTEQHKLHYSGSRLFTDSAPVLEKAIAEKSGLGWIGKNTLLLNRQAGSLFFLGEIFTSLDLPVDSDAKASNHCGSCEACIEVCPTRALVAPYQLDARRCISYLTIEYQGSIPVELRPLIGNRIFGCDDCQLICPWNKYAKFSKEDDFQPRHRLDRAALLELFAWNESEFLKRTEGSAIRRTKFQGWLRNIAIALGNSGKDLRILKALQKKKEETQSDLLSEHLDWAIKRQIKPT